MRSKGFSFIELSITLLILSLLLLLASTFSPNLLYRNQQQQLLDDMQSAINFAKMRALALASTLYLKPKGSNNEWSKGMILIHNDEVLYQWQWQHPYFKIRWNGASKAKQIRIANNPLHAISNGHFDVENSLSHEHLQIIINRLGRVSSKATPRHNNVV